MSARARREAALQLADERETAEMLRVSRASLRFWRARGGGPPWLRIGRRLVRYEAAALRRWIEERGEGAR
jgi:hypothetical protein